MEHLRTVEELCRREGIDTIYCVAAVPEWEHYDAEKCPEPIVAWGREHCPEATIERLGGFENEYERKSKEADSLLSTLPLGPVYRLGFTAEQAQLFQEHWRTQAATYPTDFYFFVCYMREVSEAERDALGGELFIPAV